MESPIDSLASVTPTDLGPNIVETRPAPSVANISGDAALEIILSLKDTLGGGDGGVQIWDVPGSADNCLLWPTGRGNLLRQGYIRR